MARLIPSRNTVLTSAAAVLACVLALLVGLPVGSVVLVAGIFLVLGLAWCGHDLWRSNRIWRLSPLRVVRDLPDALALGVPRVLSLNLFNDSSSPCTVDVFDEVDTGRLNFEGLPQHVVVPANKHLTLHYTVTPRQRGLVHLGVTQLRVRTPGGSFDILRTVGTAQQLHVLPNFAAVAGYAWLAGDRRLAQIGIKSYPQRGLGTDFKQLSEYKVGDPIRHIDWKATLRYQKPVVREFQDERDQCVFFLLDCGRRMRADEGLRQAGGSHFDQALNALMLLSHVALKEGDEVGAMTFGTPHGQQRRFAPRKGGATLNALMARLHDIEPSTSHSDYLLAAQDLLRLHRKRALVIMLTNFRDEDATELIPAVKLLRSRHLVLVASLRERALRQVMEQPMTQPAHAAEVATAHWLDQTRRDSFARVVGRDALSVDVEPAQLAVALVNRYHAVKRAGLL